jgi:hypothetical protein
MTREIVTSENRDEYIAKKMGVKEPKDAYEHLEHHFKSKLDRNKEYKKNKYAPGEDALLHLKKAKAQLNLHENEHGVHLMNIHIKNKKDLTKPEHGTGHGKEIIESLKKYADKSKKPFHVIGASEGASKHFWDKIEGLKKGSVTYKDPHGEEFTEHSSYSYHPNVN